MNIVTPNEPIQKSLDNYGEWQKSRYGNVISSADKPTPLPRDQFDVWYNREAALSELLLQNY